MHGHHRVASPSIIGTACPPTRTLEMTIPFLLDFTKSLLGRLTSTPCRINTDSSDRAAPYLTIHAEVHPAADPVAGSSPFGKIALARRPIPGSPVSLVMK